MQTAKSKYDSRLDRADLRIPNCSRRSYIGARVKEAVKGEGLKIYEVNRMLMNQKGTPVQDGYLTQVIRGITEPPFRIVEQISNITGQPLEFFTESK
jgi:hypothetical protein